MDEDVRSKLDELLLTDENRFSKLQQLKRPPSVPSAQALLALTRKLKTIKEAQVLAIDRTWLNNNYQRSLANYVHRCSVYQLRTLQPAHRYAALVCFLWKVSRDTIDYMVDMNSKLMTKLYTKAEHQFDTEMQKKQQN